MTEDDLAEVMAIEQVSFSLPWSERAYRYELLENAAAYLFVARLRPNLTGRPALRWSWFRLQNRLRRAEPETPLVGYAVLWLLGDEAHISSIAVHPAWRRRGIGSLLLDTLLTCALEHKAHTITLEVRVSNVAAQALYRAWGFRVVGWRKRYYSDNDEDALLMTTPALTSADYQALWSASRHALLERLRNGLPGVDKTGALG